MKALFDRTRREFLAASVGAPAALSLMAGCQSSEQASETPPPAAPLPVGIELYSVRQGLAQDLMGTVAQVAEIGYQVVEFYAPYFEWTPEYAREVRRHLDGLGVRALSMHTPYTAFAEEREKAIELNHIIGSQTIVMSSPPPGVREGGPDGWKRLAETLTAAQETFSAAGLRAGYHNHQYEWRAFEDAAPGSPRHGMDILAAETPSDVTLQFDVGTCVQMGQDPVAWIEANPGRIRSIHCKDWAPGEESDEKGYRVLFGEGAAPWPGIFAAAENGGGVEYYLIEQEGSRFDEMDTARRCLQTWRDMRA